MDILERVIFNYGDASGKDYFCQRGVPVKYRVFNQGNLARNSFVFHEIGDGEET